MIVLLAAMLFARDLIVRTVEPRPASPWVQSVRARCAGGILEISGYGPSRPAGGTATLRIGGRPVTGEVGRLTEDLSHGGAVYRLGILCDGATGITLRVNQGEKQPDGPVIYRSGAALFRAGRLVSYTGLQDSTEEGFWFR